MKNDLYAVVGNPIHHSLSPKIHSLFAEQTHQNIDYLAILIEIGHFPTAVHDFKHKGGKGLNITVPFKMDAFEFSEELTERAQKAQAVNTLVFTEKKVVGDNTDGVGFINDIYNNLHWEIKNKNILIVGAGGATRGLLYPLLQQQPAQITIANRTISKAEDLANDFRQDGHIHACGLDNIEGCYDAIIHASSAGHQQGSIQLPSYIYHEKTWAYDLSYGKAALPFLNWAKDLENTSDGLGMLVEQAAESFYVWRGVRPETDVVLQKIQEIIES